MKNLFVLPFLLLSFFFNSCSKTDDDIQEVVAESNWKNINIPMPEVSNITAESVVIRGSIVDEAHKLTSRGFSVNTSSSPAQGKHFECETNIIYGELTGLNPNTAYYVWLYAEISDEIKYGNPVSFTTDKSVLEKIELSTPKVQDITTNSAVVTGTIYGNENKKLSEIGICYGVKDNPTISDKCSKSSSDNINITLNELETNTTYYIRLYVKYKDEVKYGKVASFDTAKEPEVNEDDNYVKIGTIYCEGSNHGIGYSIESKDAESTKYSPQGICYGTLPNPKITDYTVEKKTDRINGLKSGTIYYIRPYLIKDGKVHYFKETSFETIGGKIKLSSKLYAKKYTINYEIAMKGTYQFVLYNWLGEKREHLGYAEKGKGSFETENISLYQAGSEWDHEFSLIITRVDDSSSISYRYTQEYDY